MQGSRTTGNEMLHTGREFAMAFDDELCVGYASHISGLSTFFDGDFDTAAQLFKEADACYTRLGAATLDGRAPRP